MSEKEIENRIEHCEKMADAHLEVGNTKMADKYTKEKYKWEKLLNELNPKLNEELRTYKQGYFRLLGVIDGISDFINNFQSTFDKNDDVYKDMEKLKEIIDKVGGNE